MATMKLTIEIKDEQLSKDLMEQGWLEMHSMPQIVDPVWEAANPDWQTENLKPEMIDKFANTKLLAQDNIADYVVRQINKGLDIKSTRENVAFTRDMIL